MIEVYKVISSLVPEFKVIAGKFCKHNKSDIDDAVQELCLYFLQMNPDVLSDIYKRDGEKGLLSYAAVALRRAYMSPRSKYYYKYKKYYVKITSYYETDDTLKYQSIYNYPEKVEVNYDAKKLDMIDEELSKMYWYDAKIFQLYYYESNTLDSLAKKTGISRNSLFNTIDRVRETIKEKLND